MNAGELIGRAKALDSTAKDALLEKILGEIMQMGAYANGRAAAEDGLLKRANATSAEISGFLDKSMRKLMEEDAALRMKLEQLTEKAARADKLDQELATMHRKYEEISAAYGQIAGERNEALEKMVKLQTQWENFMSGN
jgi:regulator of replication initiation timing